jgi:hypothetical protein
MSTTAGTIAANMALRFPASLKDVETFLGLTDWLRSFIPRYAQRAELLQTRKTALPKQLPPNSKGPRLKRQAIKVRFYEPTDEERIAFADLKAAFADPTFLTHYDTTRRLHVDLDASKQRGFAAMVYHVEGNPNGGFPRSAEQVPKWSGAQLLAYRT